VVDKIAQEFWPGPLTIILPKKACVPDRHCGTADRGCAREQVPFSCACPAPSMARWPRPVRTVSAASALFGQRRPAVNEGRIPLVLDGGASNHGIESTIIKIDLPAGTPKPVITILRPARSRLMT